LHGSAGRLPLAWQKLLRSYLICDPILLLIDAELFLLIRINAHKNCRLRPVIEIVNMA
jgi:hypothetical protein